MNLRNEVEECCLLLESNKVSDRKKSCDRLSHLLDNEDVVSLLNGGNSITWKYIISSIQECLKKDADKIAEDTKKKGGVNVKYPSAELFLQIIKTATREADDEVNISNLVGYIIGCMRDCKMKKCYETTFLLILKENILSNARCRGKLDSEDWAELVKFLKKLCEEKALETLVRKCFMLTIKWGPCSGLPPNVLREQFEFITKLCQMISRSSPMNQQEDILDVVLDFCKHTAKDNRISCCKLGEDVFSTFIDLYELNGCEAKIKRQLVEFYLLQVIIHQPGGVIEGHPCAHALDWTTWKKCLKVIYSLLNKEINYYFMNHHKNGSFFIRKGETTTLWGNFCILFVEVSRQLFLSPNLDVTMALDCSLISQGAQKRQKIDLSLKTYIGNIQETKSWLWIHIMQSIVKTYPDLLTAEDYLSLLQTLSTLQIESNDNNVISNIYNCLTVMLDIENKLMVNNLQSEIEKVWKNIGESTLRAFGLNQHIQATETLLQKLIPKKLVDPESVLQLYTSSVLNITESSIKTMTSALQNLNFILTNELKISLMKCTLNPQTTRQNIKDYDYLLHRKTAKFLVKLTLQQWPLSDNNSNEDTQIFDKEGDIKDIYFQIKFQKNIVYPKSINKTESIEKVFNVDYEANKALLNVIRQFVYSINSETVEYLLSVIVLMVNVTSYMIHYRTLDEIEVDNSVTMKLIKSMFGYNAIKNFHLYENKSDREAQKLLECVRVLDKVFTFNDDSLLVSKINDLIPFELLKSLVGILNDLQEDHKDKSEVKFELKKSIIGTLSNFSCISNTSLNRNQKHILEMMATPSYNCNLDSDYILLLTFLNTFKHSKPGVITEPVLENVLKSVQDICVARYQCSENAVEILNILYILYPHIVVTNNETIRTTSVELLNPFYEKRNEYGPEVSSALLNCIGLLCQLDPESSFSRWSNVEIIRYVPEFLCSDYQEIRFKGIETLVVFFEVMSKSKQVQDFHRQEEIFYKIYEKSLEVFEVTGEITQERRTDEIISRTASVLHTYASIILYCNSWIEECLFTLVKLTFKKNLGSVNKVLEIINKHLCGSSETNCIEKYLEYILEKWLSEDYNIDLFPFKLFHCETKSDFYLKYFEICVPLLIVTERKDLIEAAQQLGMNEADIVTRTCSKIFGSALSHDIENMVDLLERNKILSYFASLVGVNGVKSCLVDNFDQLLLRILSFLTDEKYIHDIFAENVIFSSKTLTVQQLRVCLKYVESFLCDGINIISFLSDYHISKLENVLLELKLNMYNVFTVDDKLKSFHRYAAWINVILDHLHANNNLQHFFIKDTTYMLINLIGNHREDSKLIKGFCKFLYTFLKKILPDYAEIYENFLTFTVNSLKYYITQGTSISDICLDILTFLIVQNACHLMSSIEKLDNFPEQPKFDSIRTVHAGIKYGNKKASLEEEIDFFLQHEELSNRQDSLNHLRDVLSKEKVQLQQMYDKLGDVRGFSEDCEKSSLHRLICMLAKMSCSVNEEVCLKAMKCLGEIGPADLTTLVLQHETRTSDVKCTPFELLSAYLLSTLSKYIVDPNIDLVKSASNALYIVLDSKEGRKVAETEINFGYELQKNNFLPYFPLKKSSPSSSPTVIIEIFTTKIDNNELWSPNVPTSHEEWIVLVVTSLLEAFNDKSYLPKLVPICKVAPKLCERLLPLLINLLLHINHRTINNVLSTKINLFFSSHWNLTVPKHLSVPSININKRSVKCMLDVISFIRLQKNCAKSGREVAELDLDYLKVAKAAEFCAAHFTALLYSELWCQARIQEIELAKEQNYVGLTKLDVIYENEDEQVGEALQDILRNAYRAVGDLDALPGCGNLFLLKPQFRVQHYKELENWDHITHFYEMQVSQGIPSAKKDLMESLKKCRLYQLPLLCTKQSDEYQYECLWRLGQWNIEEKKTAQSDCLSNPMHYEKYRFYSLKAIHDSNEYAFMTEKKAQSLCVLEHLKHTSLESSQNMYPVLTQLQSINEMEDFVEVIATRNFAALLAKWKLQDDLVRKNDFQYVEPLIAQRIVMLSDYLKIQNDVELKNYLVNTLLDFTDLAWKEGHFRVATRALENLRGISNLSDDILIQIQLADAQLSWSINDKMVAHHILNKLCRNSHISPKLRSSALKLFGQYMSETFSENRLVIISEYFLQSLAIIKDVERTAADNNSILDTYDKVAQFADKEYQQIMTYINSDLFRRKIDNMEKARAAGSNIHKQSTKTRDECQAAAIHVRQSKIDEMEIQNTKKERNQFLKLALKYYLMNLLHSDKNNIRIFRVMALSLENRNNPIIADTLKEILPSYKYITILPQLIPHITESNPDMYNKKVNEIIEKCAIEHPHHTLPLLLSLANSNKDRKFSDFKTTTSSNEARMETAKRLLDKLKERGELTDIINKLQQLSEALIELAYYKETESSNHRKKKFTIIGKITKIKNFDNVLLPTYKLPISITGNYSSIVGIYSFGSVYHPVGGINTPKRITCRGTDGIERSQLLKGQDDLRQDAVMQQVFGIINNLLSANKQTRHLLIRTYKIVPLSMRSGILEWVDNSIPIGDYLVGADNQPGAHQLYRPMDKSPSWCREMIKKCDKTPDQKKDTYMTICKQFKPVFHKFFETSFPHPTIWYERKRAYIHSVATTSVCGYILGIGDRHVSNIMIDKTTAEVIHIDFGIAFEQGRVLPTPETVPFRLTRDIVDGMGVSGIEGLFRRSCEKTMEVLRQNSQTIITTLEVLLYDPLYVWTVTAAEANKRQTDDENDLRSLSSESDEDNTTVNITAERALMRLREKLQGTELGNPTSIEHQVGTLIQQAMDPANLCKLYYGWQAYL